MYPLKVLAGQQSFKKGIKGNIAEMTIIGKR